MAERLNIKDTVQEWISKINNVFSLGTVDGNFKLESIDGLKILFSGGYVRDGSFIIEVPGKEITLEANSTYIIGANTQTGTLENYINDTQPTSDFIPMWVVGTNNLDVTTTDDYRTWACV